jgi:hypothetical protein
MKILKFFFIVIVCFVVGSGFIDAITPPQQVPAGLLAQQNISDGTIKRWGEEAAKLEQEAKERKVAAEEKLKREREEDERLKPKLNFTWSSGGFDTVLLLDIKIKNPADGYNWLQPKIRCITYSPDKTPLNSLEKTIYQKLPIGGQIKLKDFSMGFLHPQTATVGCLFVGHYD